MGLARYIQSSCMEMNCLVECKYKTEFAYCSKRGRYTYMMKIHIYDKATQIISGMTCDGNNIRSILREFRRGKKKLPEKASNNR